jgi:hypothetical protein
LAGALVLGCSDDGRQIETTAATLGPASTSGEAMGTTGGGVSNTGMPPPDTTRGPDSDGGGVLFDLPQGPDAGHPGACDPPDVLVVLDRSQSMHRLRRRPRGSRGHRGPPSRVYSPSRGSV